MLQIKQSLVCVCIGTEGALKWSDLLMFYWNSVMEEESFISVSFFPLSWFRPRCVQEALLGYTGWKDCKSRMNVWVFFTYKRYFCLWHFAAVKEKVPLAAVWYPDRHPITVAGTISYEDAKNSFYFCNFLWSLQTSSGQ